MLVVASSTSIYPEREGLSSGKKRSGAERERRHQVLSLSLSRCRLSSSFLFFLSWGEEEEEEHNAFPALLPDYIPLSLSLLSPLSLSLLLSVSLIQLAFALRKERAEYTYTSVMPGAKGTRSGIATAI